MKWGHMHRNNLFAGLLLGLILAFRATAPADETLIRINSEQIPVEQLDDGLFLLSQAAETTAGLLATNNPAPLELARERARRTSRELDSLQLQQDPRLNLLPHQLQPKVEALETRCCDPIRIPTLLSTPLREADFPCLDWARHVHWVKPDGSVEPYSQWPQARKNRLSALFTAIVAGGDTDLALQCPDPQVSLYYLTESQALDVYLAHVAHALALEYAQVLPWRLYRLPAAELAEILSPGAYAQLIPSNVNTIQYPLGMGPGQGYRLSFRQSQSAGFVCDPRVGYRFMTGQWPGQPRTLVGATEEETLIHLSAWFRDEVSHGNDDWNATVRYSLLKDRLTRFTRPDSLTSYWAIHGCQSAANTLADLARAVNIPLLRVGSHQVDSQNPQFSHAGLLFRWIRGSTLVLHHVDELYAISGFDWVTFQASRGRRQVRAATPEEKDRSFFAANWIDPLVLHSYGFDYTLVQVPSTALSNPTCSSSSYCDVADWGWQIGGWRHGSREKPDPKEARQKAEDYFKQIKAKIMSDGKTCWHDEDRWHHECLAEVDRMYAKLDGTYYRNELEKGYWLAKNANLGAWTLLQHWCHSQTDSWWQDYVDANQGQPSPHNFSWDYYRDRAAEVVHIYGGCQAVKATVDRIVQHKLRP